MNKNEKAETHYGSGAHEKHAEVKIQKKREGKKK